MKYRTQEINAVNEVHTFKTKQSPTKKKLERDKGVEEKNIQTECEKEKEIAQNYQCNLNYRITKPIRKQQLHTSVSVMCNNSDKIEICFTRVSLEKSKQLPWVGEWEINVEVFEVSKALKNMDKIITVTVLQSHPKSYGVEKNNTLTMFSTRNIHVLAKPGMCKCLKNLKAPQDLYGIWSQRQTIAPTNIIWKS